MLLTPVQICLCVAGAVALIGAICDIRTRRLPNWLTFPSILFGLALHAALFGVMGFLSSFAAMATCGALALVFMLAGGINAGDLKLLMAVGAISGLSHVSLELAIIAISGGIGGTLYAVFAGRSKQYFGDVLTLLSHHKHNGLTPHPVLNVANPARLRMPYGVFIAMGAVCAFLIAL